MRPELTLETHASPDGGHFWVLRVGDDPIASSPGDVTWEDADEARAAGLQAVAHVLGMAATDLPEVLRMVDLPDSPEQLDVAIAKELVRRNVLPSDFLAQHGVE